jgi:Questin oxidase-like
MTSTPDSIPALDSALVRVSALDFKIPNPFVNHGPMACEALVALGFDSEMDSWVDHFLATMVEAPRPVPPRWNEAFEWRDALGDYRLLPEWMGYFDKAISELGWSAVVETWVPRFMPGLVAALFHGVIRTAHAVRAIEAADTPARRAELARALGNWAAWFHPGEDVNGPSSTRDPGVSSLREGGLRGAEVDDPRSDAILAAGEGADCYVSEPTIFNLHGVTGAMAVELLVPHLRDADAVAAVDQLRSEHRVLYSGTQRRIQRPARERSSNGSARLDDDVVVAAAKSHDPHQVKLVEACGRGLEATGDPSFAEAAATVTGS